MRRPQTRELIRALMTSTACVTLPCLPALAQDRIDPIALNLAPIDLSAVAHPNAGNPGSVLDPDYLVNGSLANTLVFDTSNLTFHWRTVEGAIVGLAFGGELISQTNGPDVATFVFDQINTQGLNITATGSRPLAILSRGDANYSGTFISVNGQNGGADGSANGRRSGGIGVAGGYNGGDAGSGDGAYNSTGETPQGGQGPGNGIGGNNDQSYPTGGGGGANISHGANADGFGGGGSGGFAYGDLSQTLEGGSGGGGGGGTQFGVLIIGTGFDLNGGGGGAGGGAIELGAAGELNISSLVVAADGGDGRDGADNSGVFYEPAANGGGGAGGAIRLHGQTVNLSGVQALSAEGGDSRELDSTERAGGSGGGGGIRVMSDQYVMTDLTQARVSVAAGNTANLAGGTKELYFSELIVPENAVHNIDSASALNGFSIDPTNIYDLTLKQNAGVRYRTTDVVELKQIVLETNASFDTNAATFDLQNLTGDGKTARFEGEIFIKDAKGLFSGDIILPKSNTLQINTNRNQTYELSGDISGDNTLYKTGSGTLHLSGSKTFTGDIQIINGTLKAYSDSGSNSETATGAGTLHLRADARAKAAGHISSTIVYSDSLLWVHSDDNAQPNASLQIHGDLTLQQDARLRLELVDGDATSMVQADLIELDGILQLRTLTDDAFEIFDQFTILAGDVITGVFDEITGINNAGEDLAFAVTYLENQVDVTVTLLGDANLDGQVSLLDLDILGRHYGQAGTWAQGDYNGDGQVSLLDLDILGRHYGKGYEAFLEDYAALNIPEPATAMGLLSILITIKRRRQN